MTLVASAYTWLPAAPATESSASTKGTPAVNSVDNVRDQRAMVALRTMSPMTGMRNNKRSMPTCLAGERLYVAIRAQMLPPIPPKMIHQYSTNKSDSQITICVRSEEHTSELQSH